MKKYYSGILSKYVKLQEDTYQYGKLQYYKITKKYHQYGKLQRNITLNNKEISLVCKITKKYH